MKIFFSIERRSIASSSRSTSVVGSSFVLLIVVLSTLFHSTVAFPSPNNKNPSLSSSSILSMTATNTCCGGGDATTSITTTTSTTKDSDLFVTETRANVQSYYGETLQQSSDLQTNACCTAGAPPEHIRALLKQLHPETIAKYYGCGLCLPEYDLTGLSVLDLGCGAGRDVYMASQLVGPNGHVMGIDMTDAQLEAAQRHSEYHQQQFGYQNWKFQKGYLEELDALIEQGVLKPESFDLIISNCVLNLCTDKPRVLESCYKLLKPGGEMYFSDVYANRRVPEILQRDSILWGECLSGALYWNDFVNMAIKAGFTDPRLVEDSPIAIANEKLLTQVDQAGAAGLAFYSATYRLWKIQTLEPDCEDYGQAVVYRGTVPRHPSQFQLDKGHVFETNKVHPVCGNTWYMLQTLPLKDHFQFVGDFSKHFGIFEGCGSSLPFDSAGSAASTSQKSANSNSCC